MNTKLMLKGYKAKRFGALTVHSSWILRGAMTLTANFENISDFNLISIQILKSFGPQSFGKNQNAFPLRRWFLAHGTKLTTQRGWKTMPEIFWQKMVSFLECLFFSVTFFCFWCFNCQKLDSITPYLMFKIGMSLNVKFFFQDMQIFIREAITQGTWTQSSMILCWLLILWHCYLLSSTESYFSKICFKLDFSVGQSMQWQVFKS